MVLGLQMKKRKIRFDVNLTELLNTGITSGDIELKLLSDAPKLVKIISGYDYAAYKNTIYLPADHLTLMQSSNSNDRLVAVAKLLPWVACIYNGDSTLLTLLKFKLGYKLRSFYFVYEYLFLKSNQSPYADLITKGFLVTRKRFFMRVLPETVLDFMNALLTSN